MLLLIYALSYYSFHIPVRFITAVIYLRSLTRLFYQDQLYHTLVQRTEPTTKIPDLPFEITMSDDTRRHWHGSPGARHEHENVWTHGGAKGPAVRAPWALTPEMTAAANARRVCPPIHPPTPSQY